MSIVLSPKIQDNINAVKEQTRSRLLDIIDKETRLKSEVFNFASWEAKANQAASQVNPNERNKVLEDLLSLLKEVNPQNKEISRKIRDKMLWYMRNNTANNNFRPAYIFLRNLDDWMEAVENPMTEDHIGSNMQYIDDVLNKTFWPKVKAFEQYLQPFANTLERDIVLDASFGDVKNNNILDGDASPSFYIELAGTDLGCSIFIDENNKYIVDDIIDDPDFFEIPKTREEYSNLISYIRTGRLPKDQPIKWLTLYRQMSTDEYAAWLSGAEIPVDKFFTSKPTGAFAYDDPNLESKAKQGISVGLERFKVRSDAVAETDANIYVTKVPAILQNGRIIPKGA